MPTNTGARARHMQTPYASKSEDGATLTEPLFSTTLPAHPRRQTPSMNNSQNYEEEGPAITFRRADSTARALATIAQSKYNTMERRRAGALLFLLFAVAASVHVVISSDYYFNSATGNTESNIDRKFLKKGNAKESKTQSETASAQKQQSRVNAAVEEEAEDGPDHNDFLKILKNFRDVSFEKEEGDVPFFWHIPRSAGSTVKDIMGQCMALTQASEVGVRDGHGHDPVLDIIDFKGAKYVNVDTTSIDGIKRAKELGLVSSPNARPDIIVSNYLVPVSEDLYDQDHMARGFVMMRDPIERAVSMYHYQIEVGVMQEIPLEEYAKGNGIENNWMTRYIVGQMEGELSKDTLEQAKVILKKKFLIGFVDDFEESMQRLIKFNNWKADTLEQETCMNMLVELGVNRNPNGYDMPKKGSQAYSLIAWQTQFDIKLYQYAKELFDAQTKMWGTKERKKADKKKKKQNQ